MLLKMMGALNYVIFKFVPKKILFFIYKKSVNKNHLNDVNYELNGKKIAVLAPHPDDEYLAIESLDIDELKGAVTYFQLTDGLSNFDFNALGRLLRINETYEYLYNKGASDGNIIRLQYDKYFSNLEFDVVKSKFICDFDINSFDVIFTINPLDWHEEHFQTNFLLYESLSLLSPEELDTISIYLYPVTTPLPDDMKSHYSYHRKAIAGRLFFRSQSTLLDRIDILNSAIIDGEVSFYTEYSMLSGKDYMKYFERVAKSQRASYSLIVRGAWLPFIAQKHVNYINNKL